MVMKFPSRVIAAIASGSMLLALVGCDNSGSSSGSPATGTPQVTVGTTPAGTQAAPVLSGTPAGSVQVGQRFAFTPTTSGGAATMKYSVANKPAWLTFDAGNGSLSGTPAAKDVGAYKAVTLSVSSAGETASLAPFDVTVSPASSTPANLSWIAPSNSTSGGVLDLSGYHIYYGASANSLPNVVSVGAGETSYVFNNLKPGVWYFAVAAVNSDNVESTMSAVVPAQI
jgi:hypothetical protein